MKKSMQNWMADCLEDYVRLKDMIDLICCAIENPEIGMPNMFPVCNNTILTDQITMIVEHINKLREAAK